MPPAVLLDLSSGELGGLRVSCYMECGSCQGGAEARNGNTHPWLHLPHHIRTGGRHPGKSTGPWPASHGRLDEEQGWRMVTAS